MKLSEPYICATKKQVHKVFDCDKELRGYVVDDGDYFIVSVYSTSKFSSAELREVADLMDSISNNQE